MKIGELATAAACDIETIRYYEKTGLLAAPARADNGYRTYASLHLADLRFIRQCRSLQIGLADIRTLIALRVDQQASCGSVNDLVDHHIARIDVQLQSLELLRTELVQLRRQCDGPHPMEDCAILRELSSQDAEQHSLGRKAPDRSESQLRRTAVMKIRGGVLCTRCRPHAAEHSFVQFAKALLKRVAQACLPHQW